MKLKIVEPGWTNFTGHLGSFHFTDNVSDEDIGTADAAALAGIVSIIEVESGRNPSSAQTILDHSKDEAPIETPALKLEPVELAALPQYTKEQLEAVADESGIKGIRELAAPYGIVGNSIVQLIDKLLLAQADGRELAS